MSHCYPVPSWTSFAMHSPEPPVQPSAAPAFILSYIVDRLYLAAYLQPPTENTLFPYPQPAAPSRKRSQRAVEAPTPPSSNRSPPCYFSVDDILLYNAFHHDFGPLHIGHLYRFAIQFHDILGAKENKDRPIVFWSHADPRSMCSSAAYYICVYANPSQVAQTLPACSPATWF